MSMLTQVLGRRDRQNDVQTDGRETITLRFPLDAASITSGNNNVKMVRHKYRMEDSRFTGNHVWRIEWHHYQ